MPLTAAQVLQAKPTEKTQKLFDGGGMFLEITPSGGKRWRFKYRFGGKENLLSLGVFPETTLAQARRERETARALLKAGTDPSQQRKVDKITASIAAVNTFEAIALEWHAARVSGWSTSHADTCLERMKRDLFPWLGSRTLIDLRPPEILAVLKRVESRGSIETAHRCKGIVSQVFDFAIATGRAESNPASALGAALQSKVGGKHPAIVDPIRLGQMLRDIDGYAGSIITVAALKIHALTFQRPNEVSGMTWAELDLANGWWTIPSERMKRIKKHKINGAPHYVPLSKQAIEVIRELQPVTGDSTFVFPGERKGRSISENTARTALRSMGYLDHTPHGFRATARTMAREQLRIDKEVIERAMAHGSTEALGGAYDRTQYLADRIELMQKWADYLDKLRTGADVIPIHKAA